MLSMHENVNGVCNDENIVCNEKAYSSMNVNSKHKRCDDATSTKLWQYRLCHTEGEDGLSRRKFPVSCSVNPN
jgi:hypothetical protein